MPKVRGNGADKWVNRASVATEDYRQGVNNPRRDWAQATEGASDSYKQGVQKAISEDRFSKGVSKAGTQAWKRGSMDKGASRYAPGVAASKDKYRNNVQPFLDTIEQTDIGERYPRGDPRNIERVARLAKALHDKKNEMRNA